MKGKEAHTNIKAIAYLFIVIVAVGFMVIFIDNKDYLMNSGSFNVFFVLLAVACALLLGLVYLVSHSKHSHSSVKRVAARSAKKKSSKKRR